MPSPISYINPFSKQHNAIYQFKSLSKGDKVKTAIATVIAGLFSFGLAAAPVFRLLVGRFKKLEMGTLPKEPAEVHSKALTVIAISTAKKGDEAVSQVKPNEAKKAASAIVNKAAPSKTSPTNTVPIPTIEEEALKKEEEALKKAEAKRKDNEDAFRKFQEEFLKGKAPEKKNVIPEDVFDAYESEYSYGEISDDEEDEGEIIDDSYGEIPDEEEVEAKASYSTSLRTINSLKILNQTLADEGKTCGKAIDNGDCFFDSFAQSLNRLNGTSYTIKDLRKEFSDYVNDPANKNEIIGLISSDTPTIKDQSESAEEFKERIDSEFETTYKELKENSIYTFDESSEARWGNVTLEGAILCKLHNVQMRILEVGVIDDSKGKSKDINNYWKLDGVKFKKTDAIGTIEIASYPGHFMPIIPKG